MVRDNRFKQKVDENVTPVIDQSSDLCNGKVAPDNVNKRFLPFLMHCFSFIFQKILCSYFLR